MIGRTLSHFRILAKVGEGGMGVVYRAEDERLRRPVALKILPPDLVGSEERRLRFLREARAAAAVAHPNIATIYEVGEEDGVVFIAMEYIEGKTLRSLIAGRPLALKEALRIAIDVAEGLARAHQSHVIHRDLKPDNIIVGADRHVKILDFGLAKLLDDHDAAGSPEQSRLETISREMTRAGKILGTAAYMSPEQACGLALDERSDLFSFGVTTYEMVTGVLPFQGRTDTDILSAIIRDAAVPPSRINPEVPADLERIINECLEKDPQDRYQHADQLAVDLRRLKRSSESGAQAVRSPGTGIAAVPRAGWFGLSGTRTRRLALTGTLAGLLAAVGAGLWWSTRAPAGFRSGDRILVADFENATGRPEFDTAIREAFEQMTDSSSFLRVIRGEPLSELMTRKAGGAVSRLDSGMADRLCGGGDCAGYLAGRIVPEGTGYRLEAGLYRAGEKRAAVSRSAVVPSGDDILKAIFEIVIELRRSVGENPQSISAAAPPTTRSLSAYRAFAVANRQGDMGAGIDLYQQALQIDPDFVEAYASLAVNSVNTGDWREYLRYAGEAYRRSSDLPEQHREWNEVPFLEASYEFDAEIQRLKALQGLYPNDQRFPDWLGWLYNNTYEDPVAAETAYRAAYNLAPVALEAVNLGVTLFAQGKAEEIEALVVDFRSRGGLAEDAEQVRMWCHVLRGDWKASQETLHRLGRGPGSRKAFVNDVWSGALLASGRLAEARRAMGTAWTAAEEAKALQVRHRLALVQSWIEMRRTGRPDPLSKEQIAPADKSFIYIPGVASYSVEARAAEPLAALIRDHEADLKNSTSRFVREELQFARGCLALIRGKAAEARAALEPLARNSILLRRHHVLARAYESLGMWPEAAAEYEEVLKDPHRKVYLWNPAVWILDQYRAAQAYERLGDAARARQWYERFAADWKEADPDIPELVQARQRLGAPNGGKAGAR